MNRHRFDQLKEHDHRIIGKTPFGEAPDIHIAIDDCEQVEVGFCDGCGAIRLYIDGELTVDEVEVLIETLQLYMEDGPRIRKEFRLIESQILSQVDGVRARASLQRAYRLLDLVDEDES